MKRFALALTLLTSAVTMAAPRCQSPILTQLKASQVLATGKKVALSGKTVGLFATGLQTALRLEGRYYSDPADWVLFNADNSSARYVMLGSQNEPATPAALLREWNVKGKNALVEVEVNGGQGSPEGDDRFTATKVTELDGTNAYPLNVDQALAMMGDCATEYLTRIEQLLAFELETSRRLALGMKAATGPEEAGRVVYPTWNTARQRLELHVLYSRTNGQYSYGGGAFLPHRPRGGARWGLQYGIRLGIVYAVDKTGRLVEAERSDIERFQHFLPPPPAAGGPGRP